MFVMYNIVYMGTAIMCDMCINKEVVKNKLKKTY